MNAADGCLRHGYILQHILLCCMTGLVVTPGNSLLFKAAEEAFSHSIVETITSVTHTVDKVMYFQKPPVLSAGILWFAPWVYYQSCLWLALPDSHSQCVTNQSHCHSWTHASPITFLENKLMTTVSSSQSSRSKCRYSWRRIALIQYQTWLHLICILLYTASSLPFLPPTKLFYLNWTIRVY